MRADWTEGPNTIPQLAKAAKVMARWLEWEKETLALFHEYAQRFGTPAGQNVYLFVIRDALKHRGMTLEEFKAGMPK